MGNLTDNYNIIKELGRGGMGAVYLATDKRLDRKVAIKMLSLNSTFNIEQTSEIIQRFQKEARAVAKLAHPNIVGIHDIGEDNSQYYMVMEFLEGKSIGSMLEAEGSLPIEQCIDISIQMCKALNYIHANSIVHRDIKPDNIVISSDNIAKLTDFGIAQNDTEQLRLTQDGAILGSIMYISPEQLRNSKDVDNRTDIYSYGATLYQMLTGQLPFNGETVGEVVTKVLSEQPELPRKLNPSIPFELEAIVMKAMNKDKDKRYKLMEDMERDLNNLRATHSFKKNTVSTANKNSASSPNMDKTLAIGKGASALNKTLVSGSNTVIRSTATIIEKASAGEKVSRIIFKLVMAIILVYLTFNFFAGMVAPDIAANVAAFSGFQEAMIQGPYSQSIVEASVGTKAVLYCMLVVLGMLGFTAYSFPIESTGIHRNFNLSSEVIAALIVLIITGFYAFFFVARVDTMKEYLSAYNKDSASEIADFNNIIKQKGQLSYSEIIDYKRKFSRFLIKKEGKSNIYEDAVIQLRNYVIDSDYIKPNYIPSVKSDDPTLFIVNDLFNNVFAFNEPIKELYSPKINQLSSTVSSGAVSIIPPEATYKVEKDPLTNKIKNITFEWKIDAEKNKLVITPNSVVLSVAGEKYVYPKASDKTVNFNIQNLTDKSFSFFLYSTKDNSMEKNIVIEPNHNEEITVREGREFQVLILFKEKTAIPQSGNYYFQKGDALKVDKIYYETPEYYSVMEKAFPVNQTQKLMKLDLADQNLFMTKDADIVSFKLTAPKKR